MLIINNVLIGKIKKVKGQKSDVDLTLSCLVYFVYDELYSVKRKYWIGSLLVGESSRPTVNYLRTNVYSAHIFVLIIYYAPPVGKGEISTALSVRPSVCPSRT